MQSRKCFKDGVLVFDDFEARRYSYIGLMPDPGVPDPEPAAEPGWLSNMYAYDEDQPHAVTSVAREDAPGMFMVDTYGYNNNGNMNCRVESGGTYRQIYNAENRLWVVKRVDGDCANLGNTLEKWVFTYDGDGVRVQQVYTDYTATPDTIITTRYFFGGAYETAAETSTAIKYYSFAGQTIASRFP